MDILNKTIETIVKYDGHLYVRIEPILTPSIVYWSYAYVKDPLSEELQDELELAYSQIKRN